MSIKIKTDADAALAYYRGVLDSLKEARSKTKFSVVNDAQDPKTSTFYYPLVDEGRGPVFPIRAKKLRFKIDEDTEVFRDSVGPATPRRITENAQPRVGQAVSGVTRTHALEAAGENRLLDGNDLINISEELESNVIDAYRDSVERSVTSRNFDRDEVPLIDSFKVTRE
jgi:hypothetical protein